MTPAARDSCGAPTRAPHPPIAAQWVPPSPAERARDNFLTDTSGIAATEFALVLPLMVLMWLSMAQLAQLSTASAQTTLAAQSAADLMTQGDPPSFTDLTSAVDQMVGPVPAGSSITLDVVDILFNSSNTPTQSWRCTVGSDADGTVPLSLANGLGTSGQSVIMVTVKYIYTPTITGGVLGSLTFTDRSFNKPRLGGTVAKPC
jgi:Flp pilus assembly protein TadG